MLNHHRLTAISLFLTDANDAASETSSRISCWLAQLVTTVSKVIWVGMNDDSAAQNAQFAGQRNLLVADVDFSDAGIVGNNISQISSVSDFMRWSAMLLTERIEMGSSAHAAIGVITELVNMEAMETGFEASNGATHFDRIRVGLK